MTITADAREKNLALKAIADEVRLLKVANHGDPSHPYSVDIEVTTKADEVFRFEVKWSFNDAIASWLEREGEHSKLHRQMSYVDALIVVWNEMAFHATCPEERLPAAKGLRTWLADRALVARPPVLIFPNEADAIDWISKLEKHKDRLRPQAVA